MPRLTLSRVLGVLFIVFALPKLLAVPMAVDNFVGRATCRRGGGQDGHYERLERRQLLLRARAELPAFAEALRRAAGITLDDCAEVVVKAQRFPTRLDPASIDGDALVREELARRSDLATISDWALADLLAVPSLDASRRRSLLGRLSRANVPGVVTRVAEDLAERSSSGFGSVAVHAALTLAQLDELARLRPSLRVETAWVDAVLVRLRPPSWVDVQTDHEERERLLDRLWAFVRTLPPSFNALKASVLYRRLAHDRAREVRDRSLFAAYLELPRSVHYVSRDWLGRWPGEHVVQLQAQAARAAGLEPIGDDEALVRDYLAHFLLTEDGSAFREHLRGEWLDEVLATTRLLAGAPDSERWAKVLGSTRLAALRDRVDIDFAPESQVVFGPDDDVTLHVHVKNVRELEVNVFHIDALSYSLAKERECDTSLDLDGMVAPGQPRKLELNLPPLRRAPLAIALPECRRPGTYVVELIGNGRSSRALVRKGSLRHAVRARRAPSSAS